MQLATCCFQKTLGKIYNHLQISKASLYTTHLLVNPPLAAVFPIPHEATPHPLRVLHLQLPPEDLHGRAPALLQDEGVAGAVGHERLLRGANKRPVAILQWWVYDRLEVVVIEAALLDTITGCIMDQWNNRLSTLNHMTFNVNLQNTHIFIQIHTSGTMHFLKY